MIGEGITPESNFLPRQDASEENQPATPNETATTSPRPHSIRPGQTPPSLPAISRRTSCSSTASTSESCPTPDYDSGHYSGSNTSDLLFRPGISCSSDDDVQPGQEEIRAIRSELERLAKSERWYKNELKVQKRSKLELLEKLYMNERKYMRENQKLQADCKRLYALYTEIERKATEEKDELTKRIRHYEQLTSVSKDKLHPSPPHLEGLQFEVQRQKAIVEEKENLIKTLRTQKQSLLEELRILTQERDAKLLEIEKKAIALECENRTITKRCLELVKNKAQLEAQLQLSEENDKEAVSLRQTSQKQFAEISRLMAALNDHKIASEFEISHLKSSLDTSSGKMKEYGEQLAQVNASAAEKHLQNQHLEAEIEQYKKMRENFDKYVALLQGNSAELDSKCMEIEHLQTVINIQSAQLAELNKSSQETKAHYQRVTNDLKSQLNTQQKDFLAQGQQQTDLTAKRTAEIRTLRDRLVQLEGLNEKLISQLRGSSTEITRKSSEIEELKAALRDLSELSVENLQLKKLLEVKDEELEQRRVHETFIYELQNEIQKLKDQLRAEKARSEEFEVLKCKNHDLAELARKKEETNGELKQMLTTAQAVHDTNCSNFQAQLKQLSQLEEAVRTENSSLHSTLQAQTVEFESLQLENDQLKTQVLYCSQIQSELDNCREIVKQYEAEKLLSLIDASLQEDPLLQVIVTTPKIVSPTGSSQTNTNSRQINELQRETSPKVPETCDKHCQANRTASTVRAESTWHHHNKSMDDSSPEEVRELKLLQRVIEAEHRKRIVRYEVHIRTLLGKLRSYRNREAKEKSSEVLTCEKQIETLRQQLRLALRHTAELEHYKKLNLQLTSNLQSLTDDYKTILLPVTTSASSPSKSLDYDELYKLIDRSNNFVPNFTELTDSINSLREDITQFKITRQPDTSTPKSYAAGYLGKRLSLMDELIAVDDSFQF